MEALSLKTPKIPKATVGRLGGYSRFLDKLERKGVFTVSSEELARGAGVSPNQVRKDLAYFGEFGIRGVGYNVKDLKSCLLRILGLDRQWRLIIAGAGKLGCALATYQGFIDRGFVTVGIFDNDATKIGGRVGRLCVQPMGRIPEVVKKFAVRIGIIAVWPHAAQEVADIMVENGLRAILNFAPMPISVPDHIILPNVDLAFKLEAITFDFAYELASLVRR